MKRFFLHVPILLGLCLASCLYKPEPETELSGQTQDPTFDFAVSPDPSLQKHKASPQNQTFTTVSVHQGPPPPNKALPSEIKMSNVISTDLRSLAAKGEIGSPLAPYLHPGEGGMPLIIPAHGIGYVNRSSAQNKGEFVFSKNEKEKLIPETFLVSKDQLSKDEKAYELTNHQGSTVRMGLSSQLGFIPLEIFHTACQGKRKAPVMETAYMVRPHAQYEKELQSLAEQDSFKTLAWENKKGGTLYFLKEFKQFEPKPAHPVTLKKNELIGTFTQTQVHIPLDSDEQPLTFETAHEKITLYRSKGLGQDLIVLGSAHNKKQNKTSAIFGILR